MLTAATGTVRDAQRQPVPFASGAVVGTAAGTPANAAGTFERPAGVGRGTKIRRSPVPTAALSQCEICPNASTNVMYRGRWLSCAPVA